MPTIESMADELLDRYLRWREECAALDAAYDRWEHAEDHDRPLAYAAYVAQLELEEHAARWYETSARSAIAALGSEALAVAA